MHPRYQEHFRDMKKRLWSGRVVAADPLWTFLQKLAIARQFRNQLPLPGVRLTPVDYFKNHLPRFESEVQYYELRYEAERCRPEEADWSWAAFWLQELSRMTEQIETYPELYAYFRADRSDRDEDYFGGKTSVAERHALVWASFLALARYEQDLEKMFTHFLNT